MESATTQTAPEPAQTAGNAWRARLLGRRPVVGSLPDAIFALILAGAAVLPRLSPDVIPWFTAGLAGHGLFDDLMFALMVEGGFLLLQGSLTDLATRLEKRPPIWVIILIAVGLVLFSNEARQMLIVGWERGLGALIPLLLSLLQRFTMLWYMPARPRIEKIAARALVSNRIITGLGLFGISTLALVGSTMLPAQLSWLGVGGPTWTFGAGAIYFAVAAYDDWRVRRPAFAQRPRVLFRFDALRIDYLEPVYHPPRRGRK